MTVKKEGWQGGGTRSIIFTDRIAAIDRIVQLKPSGKTLTVSVPDGLPKDSS